MKNKEILIDRIILLGLIFLSFLLCFFQKFDHDEFEAVHTAWKIINNQVIFIDFFQQKPPFFHYLLIPLLKIFHDTITTLFVCKIFMLVAFSLTLFFTYKLANLIFGEKIAYITTILTVSCSFFTDKLTEIRPDTLQIMLCMGALYFLYAYLVEKNFSKFLYSSIFLGLGFVILPKSIFYLAIILLILLYEFIKKNVLFKEIFLYFTFVVLTIMPFYIHLFSIISFEQYWFFNYVINANFLTELPHSKHLSNFIIQNLPLSILFPIGLFKLNNEKQKQIGFISILFFMHVFLIKVPNKQYFVPMIPFIAMVVANLICKNLKGNYLYGMIFCIIIAPCLFFVMQIFYAQNFSQLKKIEYVLANTDKSDKVYDGDIRFNIYRNDISYFWFSVRKNGAKDTYNKFKPIDYNIYNLIKTQKPKIISAKYIENINNDFIKNNYEKSTIYKDLYIMIK